LSRTGFAPADFLGAFSLAISPNFRLFETFGRLNWGAVFFFRIVLSFQLQVVLHVMQALWPR
jgi:hypothetical protein